MITLKFIVHMWRASICNIHCLNHATFCYCKSQNYVGTGLVFAKNENISKFGLSGSRTFHSTLDVNLIFWICVMLHCTVYDAPTFQSYWIGFLIWKPYILSFGHFIKNFWFFKLVKLFTVFSFFVDLKTWKRKLFCTKIGLRKQWYFDSYLGQVLNTKNWWENSAKMLQFVFISELSAQLS